MGLHMNSLGGQNTSVQAMKPLGEQKLQESKKKKEKGDDFACVQPGVTHVQTSKGQLEWVYACVAAYT